jgi:hypothetical protein
MAAKRPTRPGSIPARAKAVRSRKPARSVRKPAAKKPAKKTPARKTPAKKAARKTPVKKTPAKKALVKNKAPAKKVPAKKARKTTVAAKPKLSSTNRRAGVAARKTTVARTQVRGNLSGVRFDPSDTVARDAIAAQTEGWNRAAAAIESDSVPSARRKRSATERLDDPEPATGVKLIERVTGSIERELGAIERLIGVAPKKGQRTETERRARTLASLARTLAELRRLRGDESGEHKRRADDDAIPRDLDELRRALSRRLERMVEGAAQLPAAGDE